MAEILAEALVPATAEEIDFSLDNTQTADAAGEDFDFDLGGVEGNEGGRLEEEEDGPTAALTKIEIAADVDEISYEEEEAGGDLEKGSAAGDYADHQSGASEHNEGADEIDYEDADVHAATHDDSHDVADADDHNALDLHDPEGAHNDIDFGFEDAGDNAGEEEQDELDHGDYDQDDTSHQNDVQNTEYAEDEDEEEDEDGEDEDDDDDEDDGEDQGEKQKPAEIYQDDSDGTGQDYDDEDDEGESPFNSLDTGLDRLRSLHPVSTFDVVVTWGEQVCPLFKTPGVDDPDSFYLEDYETMDYPLSKFLQTVRSSISSWVQGSDEIYIRVEDLGIEFGETTTEALLGQVTFHNLLALHNTLVKNDSPSAKKGVHVTLGTRPNCLQRLKDLVGGAGAGKGLSTFQPGHSGVDDSSDDTGEAEVESDNSSPDDEAEDMLEEDEGGALISDADGVDVDMAGSLDDDSVDTDSILQTTTDEAAELLVHGADLQTPTADEHDDAAAGATEEVDFIEYTNEDEDEDQVEGVFLEPTGVSDLTTPQVGDEDELDIAGAGSDLLQDISADAENLEHQDELDLLEDLDHTGEVLNQNQDADQEGVHLEPENGLEPVDHGGQQGDNDDDFLDLDGDIDENATAAESLEASNKASADEPEVSLGTSATATLDNDDEIDYEDSRPAAHGLKTEASPVASQPPLTGNDVISTETTLDAGIDEIDWDDEIKNAAPSEATSTPATAPGKRTREVDESGDGLLDDLPDLKRHRTGNSPL